MNKICLEVEEERDATTETKEVTHPWPICDERALERVAAATALGLRWEEEEEDITDLRDELFCGGGRLPVLDEAYAGGSCWA